MKANCIKCQAEYERKSEIDSICCQLCQDKANVKVYEILWAVFLVFGLIGIGMFLPFLIIPLMSGTENGYFVMEGKKGPPLKITPFALLMVNLVNTGLIITFFILSRRFKEKLENTKLRLSEIENKATQLFGGDE